MKKMLINVCSCDAEHTKIHWRNTKQAPKWYWYNTSNDITITVMRIFVSLLKGNNVIYYRFSSSGNNARSNLPIVIDLTQKKDIWVTEIGFLCRTENTITNHTG